MHRIALSSRPSREWANQQQLSVSDGVGLATRISPALQHATLRMPDDHAVQASPLEPIRSRFDLCPRCRRDVEHISAAMRPSARITPG